MPLDITPQSPPPTGGVPRLLGRLASRGWKVKLYAPESGAVLCRAALLLGGDGSPPRRSPDEVIGRVGSVDEVVLMAREAAAWRRFVLDTAMPSPNAYMAECCA